MIEIPKFNTETGEWSKQIFETRDDLANFVRHKFETQKPGMFKLKNTWAFNAMATKFEKEGFYCQAPFKSKDFISFWNEEKEKCTKGVIIDDYFLTRYYYFFLNYLRINDKRVNKLKFPDILDSQYYFFLYEYTCEMDYKYSVVLKKRQWGGLQCVDSLVLTPNGYVRLGDLKIDDIIMNPDGTEQKVNIIIEHPNQEQYEFEFIDGRKTTCGGEHIWEVIKDGNIDLKTTNQLLESYKKEYKSSTNYFYSIPYNKPMQFEKKNLDIDPYLLGYLLGDGSLQEGVRFTTQDEFIVNHIQNIVGNEYEFSKEVKPNNKASRYTIKHKERKLGYRNPIVTKVRNLELYGKNTETKFIPEKYKYSSIEDRISLVQGMMDSDGFINAKGLDIHYTTINKTLANDFAFLTRSLGLKVKIVKKESKKHKDFYRVRISGKIDFDLFKLPRKLNRQKLRKESNNECKIINIKKLNYEKDSRCIVVDNPNHLYITNDFIVTHNTFQHLAILLNDVWFEEGFINKIAAFDDEFIKADWAMIEEYRDFLNAHTAWYRPFNPNKTFNWQQKIEVKDGNRTYSRGNKSILKGLNLKLSPSKGVGGKNNKFYYEEAGITKSMRTTFQYIDPALKLGALTTGIFMASGSVGELDQCEELKEMFFNPKGFNVLSVKNDFSDNVEFDNVSFFVPEYWSMPPFIDKDGNSIIEEAREWCINERLKQKDNQSSEDYRLYISQHPFTPEEAFDWRKDSIFPQDKILKQQDRIHNGKIKKPDYVNLEYDDKGKVKFEFVKNPKPLERFPLRDRDPKDGEITVWEFPEENAPFFTYFAGVDPVLVDKTSSSDSLFAIYIFKNLTEKTYKENEEVKVKVDGYKLVASYVGRKDELTKTNRIGELLLVWYNALAAVENNVMEFINHMQTQNLQRHLATKEQLSFVSDLKTNKNVYLNYGFKMNETIRTYFVNSVYDYLTEELGEIKKTTGEKIKTIYGVERIPDLLLLEELKQYHDKLNVDRFVAFGAGLALMKAFRKHNIGVSKIDTTEEIISEDNIIIPNSKKFFSNKLVYYTNEPQQHKKSFFR